MKSLMRDFLPFKYSIIEQDQSGKMIVQGVFQKADVMNGNGRVYPRKIWERLCSDPKVMGKVRDRAMVGECEHPADGLTNLSRVSHLVTDFRLEDGGDVVGKAEIFNTPSGQILKELFRNNVQVGISSRGKGTSHVEGEKEVVHEDYDLETFDFVYNPSTPGAYPQVIRESIERILREHSVGKLGELKQLLARAHEVSAMAGKVEEDMARKLQDELVSMQVAASRLMHEDKALEDYGREVLCEIKESRIILDTKLSGGNMGKEITRAVEAAAGDDKVETLCKKIGGLRKMAGSLLAVAKREGFRVSRKCRKCGLVEQAGDIEIGDEEDEEKPCPTCGEDMDLAVEPPTEGDEPEKKPEAGEPTPDAPKKEGDPEPPKAEDDPVDAVKVDRVCPGCGYEETNDVKKADLDKTEEDEPCPKCGQKMEVDTIYQAKSDDRECPGCGAEMAVDAKNGKLSCPKCHAEADLGKVMSKGEALRKYRSALRLAQGLAEKCKSLHRSNRTLRERYEGSVALLREMVDAADRQKLERHVTKLVTATPRLKKIENVLRDSKSIGEADKKAKELLPLLSEERKPAPAPKPPVRRVIDGLPGPKEKTTVNRDRFEAQAPKSETDMLTEKILATRSNWQ